MKHTSPNHEFEPWTTQRLQQLICDLRDRAGLVEFGQSGRDRAAAMIEYVECIINERIADKSRREHRRDIARAAANRGRKHG